MVDSQGQPRPAFENKLKWLIAECDRRGLVVDVTLARGKVTSAANPGGRMPNFEAHQRAVETVVNALNQHHNWYLDLANERDVHDDRYVPPAELKRLRELVHRLDPSRFVTASFGGHDLSEQDIRDALLAAGLDFLSPHRPRNSKSPAQTESRTRDCLALMKQIGRIAPVHYQEPFRRGYTGWEPSSADFLSELRGAVAGGAVQVGASTTGRNAAQRTSSLAAHSICERSGYSTNSTPRSASSWAKPPSWWAVAAHKATPRPSNWPGVTFASPGSTAFLAACPSTCSTTRM